jgi:ubiquinone biosynthesis protein
MRLLQITKELIIISLKTKPWMKKSFASKRNAIIIRESFERLGSIYIKLGQMLALRPDYVPEVLCDEFSKLLDRVPPFDEEKAYGILKQELGEKIVEVIDFVKTPIASASFAQVHKAKLKNGLGVAIKIQRPGLFEVVDKDIKHLKLLAAIYDLVFDPANKLTNIVLEFEAWTKDELDYIKEAANILKFNKMAGMIGDGVRGPDVYMNLSSKTVLVMEYIEGLNLNMAISMIKNGNRNKLIKSGFDGKEAVTKILKNALEAAHVYGYFHADPHPANIIFTPEKEIVYIDFGIMGILTKKERILILRHLRTLLSGDVDESFRTILDMCEGEKPDKLEKIKKQYGVLVNKIEESFDSDTYLEQQTKSGPYLNEIVNLMQKNGLRIPIGIVRYFKSFETLEGLIFALFPKMQVKDMLKEFRRVSIINIVDSLPDKLNEKTIDNYMGKFIDSVERSLFLNN